MVQGQPWLMLIVRPSPRYAGRQDDNGDAGRQDDNGRESTLEMTVFVAGFSPWGGRVVNSGPVQRRRAVALPRAGRARRPPE